MAKQKIRRPTFHAPGLSTTREVFERGGRLAGNNAGVELILRQSVVLFQIGRLDGDEFHAQLTQDSKFIALLIFAAFCDVPHSNRGKLPRGRPDVLPVDRCRVARIGAVNRGEGQTAVVSAPADWPDLVERPT